MGYWITEHGEIVFPVLSLKTPSTICFEENQSRFPVFSLTSYPLGLPVEYWKTEPGQIAFLVPCLKTRYSSIGTRKVDYPPSPLEFPVEYWKTEQGEIAFPVLSLSGNTINYSFPVFSLPSPPPPGLPLEYWTTA